VTSGLLLNPNSKYDANFIPFSTLADWNDADADVPEVEYGNADFPV
jgi:hypothetical protein